MTNNCVARWRWTWMLQSIRELVRSQPHSTSSPSLSCRWRLQPLFTMVDQSNICSDSICHPTIHHPLQSDFVVLQQLRRTIAWCTQCSSTAAEQNSQFHFFWAINPKSQQMKPGLLTILSSSIADIDTNTFCQSIDDTNTNTFAKSYRDTFIDTFCWCNHRTSFIRWCSSIVAKN